MAKGLTYKAAGVDMEAGDALVDQIRSAVERTHGPRVVDLYGHFAGVFSLDFNERLFKHNYRHPMLVAGTDGVGTKLRLAIDAGRVRTVGQDLVAMCVNDIVVLGAEPMFFLDYLATGHVDPKVHAEVVIGIAEACQMCDCASWAARPPRCPAFTPPATSTWRALPSASSNAAAWSPANSSRRATPYWAWRPRASTPTATAWCARSSKRPASSRAIRFPNSAARRPTPSLRPPAFTRRRS